LRGSWWTNAEIDEIEERQDISDEHKKLILGENAKRFYKI